MRLEINAGGLDRFLNGVSGFANRAGHDSASNKLIRSLDDIVSRTNNLNGGVGALDPALDSMRARRRMEESRITAIETVQHRTNDFIDMVVRADQQVTAMVSNSTEQFYRTNPWLRPTPTPTSILRSLWDNSRLSRFWNRVTEVASFLWDGIVIWYKNSPWAQRALLTGVTSAAEIKAADTQISRLATAILISTRLRISALGALRQAVPPVERASSDLVEALMGVGVSISAVVSLVSDLFDPHIKANYEHNLEFEFHGFIYAQRIGDASKLRMGRHENRRDGWYNGCGWIATYNAALLLGDHHHPADIIKHFETHGGSLANGAFGTNPVAMNIFFRNQGFETSMHNLPTSVDDHIRNSTVSILTYAHTSGVHTVAVYYANGVFHVLNAVRFDSTDYMPGVQDSVDAAFDESDSIWPISVITLR